MQDPTQYNKSAIAPITEAEVGQLITLANIKGDSIMAYSFRLLPESTASLNRSHQD